MIALIVRNFVLLAAVLIAMAIAAALFLAALLGMARLVRGAHPWPARPGGPKAPPTHPPMARRRHAKPKHPTPSKSGLEVPPTGDFPPRPSTPPWVPLAVHDAATQPIPRLPKEHAA